MLRPVINAEHGLRFVQETRLERSAKHSWFQKFNMQMDAEINAAMAEAGIMCRRADEVELDITVVRPQTPAYDEHGFIDWFDCDCSNGFHVFTDDELEDILQFKAVNHVHDDAPVLEMHFQTSTHLLKVDYSKPYHAKLAGELENLPSNGPERKKALDRIRYSAKKIGLKGSSLSLEWFNE